MRGLKGTCAWLPHEEQITAKYSRTGTQVVAGLAGGTPAGSAAGAPLGLRGEPLLSVELLVGGGMDELNPAIDAREGSIGVRHGLPPQAPAAVARPAGSGLGGARGGVESWEESGARTTQVPMSRSLLRAHR